MDPLLEIILRNAVGATLLAGVVAVVTARRAHPAVAHGLWVLVLAKLIVPAALVWGFLPALASGPPAGTLTVPGASWPPGVSALSRGMETPVFDGALPTIVPGLDAGPVLLPLVLPLLGLGGLIVLGVGGFRAGRFRRLVAARARNAPELEERAARIGKRLGLRRVPAARLVEAVLPPALWAAPRAEILVPAALWETLAPDERDALIAHELAHYRRRDHWVRFLELAATVAFWWFPLVWWARGRLRASEEAACDSLALSALDAHRRRDGSRSYASALLKTLGFLSQQSSGAVPALATGAGDFSRLKERMVMIVRNQTPRTPSRSARRMLTAGALLVLIAGPSWSIQAARSEADPADVPAPAAPPASPAAPAARPAPPAPAAAMFTALPELVELQQEEMALRLRLEELRMERERLDLTMQDTQLRQEALQVAREAEELESQGHREEAALLRERAELFRQELEVRRKQLEAEHAYRTAQITREHRMQELEMRQHAAQVEQEVRRALKAEEEARRAAKAK